MADRPTAEPQVLRCTCLCPESTHTGPGGHCTKSACRDEPCTPMSEWLKEQQAEQRPTASTVTDDQLEALYAELAEATDAVKEAREMTERGHAEVKRAQEVMGRTQARAEGAEQQLANVRGTLAEVLACFQHDTHAGRRCKQSGHVPVETVDRWRAVLDGAQQPGPDAEGLPCRHGCRAAADELAQQTQQDGHTGGR